jgi:hypothetical protein
MIDSRSLRIALLSLLVLGPPLLSFNLNHTGHIVRNGSLHTCIPNWRSNMMGEHDACDSVNAIESDQN